jgi:alkylation response protein AidB-like acyl-CoA dehydrogenase
MRFELTDEQQMVQGLAREFAEQEVKPVAAECDREARFPHATVKRMGELGLLGIMVPEKLGGGGADTLSYVLALEEVAVACASHAVVMSVSNSLVCGPLAKHGTPAQHERFLTPLAPGAGSAASPTEPQAGSDARNPPRSRREGDDYVLDGRKVFVTSGRESTVALVFVQTDAAKAHRGISAFLIEKGTPGFLVPKVEDKLGLRASDTAEFVFEGCRVSAVNRLGAEGEGFKIAMAALDGGRIGIAAQAVGIARAALEAAVAYARERRSFGVPSVSISDPVDAGRHGDGGRRPPPRGARRCRDRGQPYGVAASMAALRLRDRHARGDGRGQVHGGYGYMKEYPVERFFRDAKITQIYEGTSQIQRLVIGRSLLEDR